MSTLVWDLPIRLTHWLFVACVVISWWTAEQRLMSWHRYSGYTLLGLLVFRIYWGFVGSSTARFAEFVRGPRAVIEYLRLPRQARAGVSGHTPLGSWSVMAMLAVMLLQVGLGLFATDIDGLESGPLSHWVSFDTGRAFTAAHELVFDGFMVLVALHVAAILFHVLFERNNLLVAMLSGRKRTAGELPAMRQVPAWRAWVGVALAVFLMWLIAAA